MNRCTFPAFLIWIILVFETGGGYSQNAPVTTATTVVNAVPGAVIVPITVTGFNNIGSFSLTLDYEYAGMHFSLGTKNPLLGGTFSIYDSDLGTGWHRITISWFSMGVSLPNGSSIVDITFAFISGYSSMLWFDNGGSCQYSDNNFNILNDIPTSSYYISGFVCGILPGPGPISGSSSVCVGQAGLYYSISPVPGASGYSWTVPPGAVITGGGNTPWILVDYGTGASSGNVTVSGVNPCGTGPSSQLAVTVNPLPIADAGNDITIPYGTSTYLHAADGGSGSFGYHWSPGYLLLDPDVQDPLTVLLTSTNVFTVLVTNLATQCQNSDEVVVYVSGGPLNVNPVAYPDSVCRGASSQLYANPGGGSGSYTYLWTCIPPGDPPWSSALANPVVTPDTTTQYFLTVSDGFNTADGTTAVAVTPVPGTPLIQLNGAELSSDTCCGNQWYRDGIAIAGATGQYYTVTEDGLYFDIVSTNGCYSDTSNLLDVTLTGIEPVKMQPKLLLYPNPVDCGRQTADGGRWTADGGRRTVDGGRQTADGGRWTADGGRRTADGGLHLLVVPVPESPCQLRVFDMNGKALLEEEKVRFYPGEPVGVSIPGLGPGFYILVLIPEGAQPLRSIFLVR